MTKLLAHPSQITTMTWSLFQVLSTLSILLIQEGKPVAGEGTVLVRMHEFRLFSGCPDYGRDLVRVHTGSCEVFLRVCLRAGEEKAAHNSSQAQVAEVACPPGGYTTELFQGVRRNGDVSLSTAQPAKLAFEGPATENVILIELWGHPKEVTGSKFKRFGVFMKNVTATLGNRSSDVVLDLNGPHRATLSIQWQIECTFGYWPVGICSKQCEPTECSVCTPEGKQECRQGCAGVACNETGMPLDPTQHDCFEKPCLNGGSCLEATKSNGTSRTAASYCVCPYGYSGKRCESHLSTSKVKRDEDLSVTVIILTSIGIAFFAFVGSICLCFHRFRRRQRYRRWSHSRNLRLENIKRTVPIFHPHLKTQQESLSGECWQETPGVPGKDGRSPTARGPDRIYIASEEEAPQTPMSSFQVAGHTYEVPVDRSDPASRQHISIATQPSIEHSTDFSSGTGSNNPHINAGYEIPIDSPEASTQQRSGFFSGLRSSLFWRLSQSGRDSMSSAGKPSLASVNW